MPAASPARWICCNWPTVLPTAPPTPPKEPSNRRCSKWKIYSSADGPLITSGAASAHYNLTLRLIRRLAGSDLALFCARRALVDRHRPSQAPYADFQQFVGHDDPLIARAQQWLQQHLSEPFVLGALAATLATSERTLMRRFRQSLGAQSAAVFAAITSAGGPASAGAQRIPADRRRSGLWRCQQLSPAVQAGVKLYARLLPARHASARTKP